MTRDAIYTLVWTDFPKDDEDAFNRWYDGEHIRDRLAVPGIVEASRYIALSGGPKYVASYKAVDRSVLSSAQYIALRAQPDPRSSIFIPKFANTIRSIFQSAAEAGSSRGGYAAFYALHTEAGDPETLSAPLTAKLPSDTRLRILPTDMQIMAEQTRGLAQSARTRMRPPDRVPACIVLLEADSQEAIERSSAQIGGYLKEHTGIMSSGIFKRTTFLQKP